MSDLISRQEIRKAMYHEAMEKDSDEQKWDSGCWIRYKMFERVLEALPSADVVEVVRCKHCKHFDGERTSCYQDRYVPFDHFYCYYGERKEDAEIH